MTTEDLMKLADAYGRACRRDGTPARESDEGKALLDALEALGWELAELKPLAALGAEMHAMTTTVHTDSIPFNEQLQIVPSLWLECMKERDQARAELESKAAELESVWSLSKKADEENDTLRAELAAIRAQEPVGIADGSFNHNCPVGTQLYTHPIPAQDVNAGLVEQWSDEAAFELAKRKCGLLFSDVLHMNKKQIGALVRAALTQSQAAQVEVMPERILVTDEMHRAAVKVLHRASGLDGLPQRMMDAMLATHPQATEPAPSCTRCGATTGQACNDMGCGYLEAGNGEPAPSTEGERAKAARVGAKV